jgi:hypothetical protein
LAYPDKVRHPAPAGEHRPPTAPFSADTQALAWLDAERPNLLAAIQHAAAHGPPETAWLLADALCGYFLLRRYDIDWPAAARSGLAAAGDDQPAAQATMRLSLADRHWLVQRSLAASAAASRSPSEPNRSTSAATISNTTSASSASS